MKKRRLCRCIFIVISILTILISVYVGTESEMQKYKLLFLLPSSYFIYVNIFFYGILKKEISWFDIVFNIITFLRYVLYPFCIVFVNYDSNVAMYQPTVEQCNTAILLMCYEIIIYSFFFLFIHKIEKNKLQKVSSDNDVILINNKFIYIIFIVMSFIFIFFRPQGLNYFTFFLPKEKLGMSLVDTDILTEIAIICLIVAKGLIFVLIMSFLKQKNKSTNKKKYIILSILTVILNSIYYYGQSRSQFLFSTISSTVLFIYLYPKYRNKIIIVCITCIAVILPVMNKARGTFDFYSKEKGFRKEIIEVQYKVNQYFGGINNVAIGLETSNMFDENRNINNLIYDFIRPIVGVNMLVKEFDIEYSNKYYNYCFFQDDFVAVIFPTIAQGHFYFGFYLSPLLGMLLIYIAKSLEFKIYKERRIEYIYFFMPVLLQLGTLMGGNINIQFNYMSMQIMIPIILIALNKRIVYRRK